MNIYMELITRSINNIFNCCPTVIKKEIIDHTSIIEVKENEVFIKEGDRCEGVFVIVKGSAKLLINRDGKKQIFSFKTVDDLLGLSEDINHTNFNYTAVAMDDTVLGYIPQAQIEKIITTYPHAFLSLIKKVNDKAEEIERRSSLIMTDSAEEIVINTVADLKNKFGVDNDGYLKVHISAKDLAGYTCMSKTNLYRVLQSLKKKNLLSHHLDRYRLVS